MYIDYLTAAALADELRRTLLHARVQDVRQVDRLTVALELYSDRRHYLSLSADAGHPGLRWSQEKARRGEGAPSPLTLALRARVRGARLIAVEQPPLDRCLHFVFSGAEETRLVAELMGRMANLILTDAEAGVLAVARPIGPEMTRARSVIPGRPYMPPPASTKSSPRVIDEAVLGAWLKEDESGQAWRSLVKRLAGVSPLAAREIVHRAGGDAKAKAGSVDPIDLLRHLRELFEPVDSGRWQPSVAVERSAVAAGAAAGATADAVAVEHEHGHGHGRGHESEHGFTDPADRMDGAVPPLDPSEVPTAYAPYALTHRPAWRPVESIAEAIEAYVRGQGQRDAYADARAFVQGLLEEARARCARRLASLEEQLVDEAEVERLKQAGEAILAFQWQVSPGQERLEVDWTDGPMEVRLNPEQSPIENAQRYFDRYQRKKRAAQALPRRVARCRAELATLDQLLSDLSLAEDRPSIDAVHEALRDGGYLGRPLARRKAGGESVSKPLSLISSDGLTILVGRNSRQNEIVTFERAARSDLWLHVRGIPGAHVVIKCAGREVPEQSLREAAGLAAHFSRARGERRVDVIVTEVKNISRMRGGGPGMVRFRNDRSIQADPLAPEALDGP